MPLYRSEYRNNDTYFKRLPIMVFFFSIYPQFEQLNVLFNPYSLIVLCVSKHTLKLIISYVRFHITRHTVAVQTILFDYMAALPHLTITRARSQVATEAAIRMEHILKLHNRPHDIEHNLHFKSIKSINACMFSNSDCISIYYSLRRNMWIIPLMVYIVWRHIVILAIRVSIIGNWYIYNSTLQHLIQWTEIFGFVEMTC